MAATLIIGFALVVLGLIGAADACVGGPDDNGLAVALVSGLSFAAGLAWLAVGSARHGYHRRPLHSPPGDLDPKQVSDPLK